LRNNVVIAGAIGKTYTLVPADLGTEISVEVTGTLLGYVPTSVVSSSTSPVKLAFTASPIPLISGTLMVGNTITANPGSWQPSGASTSLSYEWLAAGVVIEGQTSNTLRLRPEMLNRVISVRVTGVRDGYASTSVTSANSVAITPAPLTSSSVPSVIGSPNIGQELSVNLGSWDEGVSFAYTWRRGTTVVGTSRTYVVQPTDRSAALTVTVTGAKLGYITTTRTSTATALVTGPFIATGTPTISGTSAVGKILTANPGTWSPLPSFTYKWLRNNVVIAGAIGKTYTLVPADLGTEISVEVTPTLTGFGSDRKLSNPTMPIGLGAFINAPAPVISGTLGLGKTLTLSVANWNPVATYSYKWFADGSEIFGETASSWTVNPQSLGKTITAQVTGTAYGFESQTKVSAPRSNWNWVSASKTYTGANRFLNCIEWPYYYAPYSWQNVGRTFDPCDFYGSSGVGIYSAGYGGVLGGYTQVLSYVEVPATTRRYKLTFNGARTYSSFYSSSSDEDGYSPADTIQFPIGFYATSASTTWITPRTGTRAYFIIFARQSGFLYFDSVTVTYESIE
jgi:hypothetical protein